MSAVALRGLLSRKLRTTLTMVAIVLGVSMISGTYVLTDTINHAFTSIFTQAAAKTDAVIQPKSMIRSDFSQPPPLPGRLLRVVRNTPGVSAAEGIISDRVQLVNKNGSPLGSTSGPPTLLFSRSSARFSELKLIKGREPAGNGIAVDTDTARRHHLRLGQTVGIVATGPLERFTIVGVVKFGSVGSLAGATIVSMDLPTAQRLTGKVGEYDQIRVAAASGVTPSDLVQRLKLEIPPRMRRTVKIQTSSQSIAATTADIGKSLNFLTIALLAFGGIAVFVGAFVIFNTFSITVAQRAREFALLRAIGATRSQVLRSVITEAVAIGLLASILGLAAGLGIAKGLNALFVGFGVDLPNTGTIIATRTVVVALAVGTAVTVLASLMPAVRATRVAPVVALREGTPLPKGKLSRFTPLLAAVLTVLGIVLLAVGVFASISDTGQRLLIIGLGAVILFLGVAMLSPQLVGPLANAIGWPIDRLTNMTGRLARENAVRNPSRTAITAAALMIGLALVAFVTIFAAELKKTADDAVNREIVGSFAIYSDQNGLIPGGSAPVVMRVPGVQTASAVKVDGASLPGVGVVQTNGLQPATFGKVYRFQWIQGSAATLAHLGPHGALIDDNMATGHHLKVGSVLHLTTPAGIQDTFTVAGIYKNSQFLANLCIRYDTMLKDWKQPKDFVVVVAADPGQNLTALKARITRALKAAYPTAAVHSQQDLKNQQDSNVNQLLALIYVLLAMSVLVSLFGIINTLVLSVYERTREIGMLRAIGTTRTQVRWLIRWESVITAVIGAILGLAIGIILAVIVTAGLSGQGIEYALPIGQLLIWVAFAVLFGIVAAAFPARRAARLDVLRAVSYE